MNEYAFLTPTGNIANVCTTRMSMAELQERTPEYKVVPLASVPTSAKMQYPYWSERP